MVFTINHVAVCESTLQTQNWQSKRTAKDAKILYAKGFSVSAGELPTLLGDSQSVRDHQSKWCCDCPYNIHDETY